MLVFWISITRKNPHSSYILNDHHITILNIYIYYLLFILISTKFSYHKHVYCRITNQMQSYGSKGTKSAHGRGGNYCVSTEGWRSTSKSDCECMWVSKVRKKEKEWIMNGMKRFFFFFSSIQFNPFSILLSFYSPKLFIVLSFKRSLHNVRM